MGMEMVVERKRQKEATTNIENGRGQKQLPSRELPLPCVGEKDKRIECEERRKQGSERGHRKQKISQSRKKSEWFHKQQGREGGIGLGSGWEGKGVGELEGKGKKGPRKGEKETSKKGQECHQVQLGG